MACRANRVERWTKHWSRNYTVVYRISSLLKENNFEKSLLPVSKQLSF